MSALSSFDITTPTRATRRSHGKMNGYRPKRLHVEKEGEPDLFDLRSGDKSKERNVALFCACGPGKMLIDQPMISHPDCVASEIPISLCNIRSLLLLSPARLHLSPLPVFFMDSLSRAPPLSPLLLHRTFYCLLIMHQRFLFREWR